MSIARLLLTGLIAFSFSAAPVRPASANPFTNFFWTAREREEDAVENCDPVDLVEELKLTPPEDQGDIGWCFARVAADLLSTLKRRHYSYLDIAFKYNQRFKRPFIFDSDTQAGSIVGALDTALNEGVCVDTTSPETYQIYEDLKRIEGDRIKNPIAAESDPNLEKKGPFLSPKAMKLQTAYAVHELFPGLPQDEMKIAIQSAVERGGLGLDYEAALEDASCSEMDSFQKKPRIVCEVNRQNADAEFISACEGGPSIIKIAKANLTPDIDAQLNLKVPVGINFWNTLEKTKPAALYDQTNPDANKANRVVSHASSVVGRRENPDGKHECQYLIRGTWGEGFYRTDEQSFVGRSDHGNGYVWVPRLYLKSVLKSITYLESE